MEWSIIIGILIGSFVATHVLVHWLQRRRLHRIERKSLELCGEAAALQDDPPLLDERVPVTLVTGFLGSGKTTLVNRVLTSSDHGLRIAVIENELGAISIDHELIDGERQASMPDGVVVLKNGCMCCSGETPGSELERILDKLLEMGKLEGGSLPFDCVLVETTGMADPAPIVQILYRREMADSRFYLDAVLTVVDCKHALRHLRPSGPFGFARRRAEAEKQLALADRVILNKMDLVDAAEAAAVEAAVESINSTAPRMRATRACIAIEQLLRLRAFDSAAWLAHSAATTPTEPTHAASVRCVSLESARPIVLARLQTWLQELIAAKHDELYRMKGVLAIAGHDQRFVLHGVHAQVQGHFERPWAEGDARRSALVVIAHRLERATLEASFRACVDGAEREEQDAERAAPCCAPAVDDGVRHHHAKAE